jgi:hypothetical protein
MGFGSEAEFEEEMRDDVSFYFPMQRDYVAGMAAKGNGLLIWLS